MKKSFNILLLFIIISSFSQKSGSVEYKIQNINFNLEFKPGFEDTDEEIKQIIEIAKNQTFTLQFNKDKSSFISSNYIVSEGIITNPFYEKLAKISFTSEDYFIDIKEKKRINLNNDGTIIEKLSDSLIWNLLTETKIIDGYLCYKASYEYKYLNRNNKPSTDTIIAWYSPNLNFAFGPKRYYGLPGLILELTERNTTFLATRIKLFDKEIEINFPTGKKISEEEYRKFVLSQKFKN